ncbi:MAG: nucleotide exchange factor GrpE, partial [Caldilinea sp.]|nr:nucleotide exchange factor GrpE [Caldilinea sp.]
MTKKNSEKQETQAQAGVDAPEVVEVEADEVAAEREGDTAANGAPEAIELDPAELLETIARLEAELAEANQQAAEVTEKSQRLAAEFQNSRRRQERQLAEQIERSSMHLIKRLLPAMDDFDLAFANVPEATDAEAAWIDGFRQIQRKLRQLLEE